MGISYKPLWKQLIDKDIKKIDLIKSAGLTTNAMANMGKDKYISLQNLEKICRALECTPNEVISFKTEKVKNE
ncbi:transcriptional regulator [Listeria monocytogenes]|uniref:Helix-turn-helix domain-containing protein n=2 Tax=Listeria monocytogenes TaxID=1639 RepID=A0A5Z1J1Q8_LISMN|nr:helix-turn-helix domain-containing protein [Listeria monocytogenes]EAE1679182.1 transcriptional regulator [Listeria monocytogenes LIS0071]MCX60367.1 transcriptional regulator [Listeria monocytogenes serotype 4b]AGR18838.1 transcriptional regulator [Listeria monocytogenes]AGR21505.1 transcriptional regulator [Listeria monocytogenes]AGR24612.1 transcriptional regulator [Listeria monocytogenes]